MQKMVNDTIRYVLKSALKCIQSSGYQLYISKNLYGEAQDSQMEEEKLVILVFYLMLYMLNSLKMERQCCFLNSLLLLKSHLKIKNLQHNNIRTLQGIFSEMLKCFGWLKTAALLLYVSEPAQSIYKWTSKICLGVS